MSDRYQTLLTGFGPFGTVVSNPTERLIRHFQTEEVPGHDLSLRVLPVSYARVPELLRAEIEVGGNAGRPFDIILMLGVATGSKQWRVEQVGRNANGDKTDADGFTPGPGPILPDMPEILPASLPTDSIVAALEGIGLPVTASENAGGYLCNNALYTTLLHLKTVGHPARAGFLHVPADEQTFTPGITTAPMFSFAQHIAAVRAALDVLAQRPSENQS